MRLGNRIYRLENRTNPVNWVLLDATGDKAIARQWYQDFKKEVIAHMPTNKKLQLSEAKVIEWLEHKGYKGEINP